MPDSNQLELFERNKGFIAALDQSGGSTPKALADYGIAQTDFSSEAEMFDLIHQARTRVVKSPVFNSERIIAAILFQGTVERPIDGIDFVDYLWKAKGILPILKIDNGLEETNNGVQLLKEIPGEDSLLVTAKSRGIFGTKQRSVIHQANSQGIATIVTQQFELGKRVLDAGLLPILEPEISISAPDKAESEQILKQEIFTHLNTLGSEKIALKLSLPSIDGFYHDLVEHPNIARVLASSGGYSREEANLKLARNPGVIASFSRALLDGLKADQTKSEFDSILDKSIESIFQASLT